MKARAVSIITTVLLWSAGARASSSTIIFLTASPPELDDDALAEAVTIYSRDIGLTLERRGEAPLTVTADSLGSVVALVRRSGVRLAFWYVVRHQANENGDVILYAVSAGAERPEVDALRIHGLSGAALYRALGLKVRAILTGAAASEPHEPVPSPLPPPPLAAPPKPTPPSTVVVSARGPRLTGHLSTAYRLTMPLDPTLIRHGILFEAALVLYRRFEIFLGTDVSSQPTHTVSAGSATLLDVPLRIGGRVFVSAGRFVRLGVGPAFALHVLSVSGFGADGARGDETRQVAGIGGMVSARFRLSAHLLAEVGFVVEQVLPPARFLLHGVPVLTVEGPLFGLNIGFGYAVP
jgi:hypothetical protein